MPAKKPRKRKLNKNDLLAYLESNPSDKREIENYLLSHLLNTATEDDFLQIKYLDLKKESGIIYKGNKQITDDEQKTFIIEAKQIKKLRLYRDIIESMRWVANDRIFNHSKSDNDIVYGKAMLYTLDVLVKKVENISNLTD